MAVIKTRNMHRPNILGLFSDMEISLNNFNITNAEDLLQRANIIHFPVDLNIITELLGLRIIRESLTDGISGILDIANNSIVVEERHPLQRQNFTIAHEIAHFCLHRNEENRFQDKIFFRGAENNTLEYQANEFAGALLMPEDEFFNQIRSGNKTIEGLARYFGVSTLAVRVRAQNLHLTGHKL